MNTHGAVDLAPTKAKIELGRFHDPSIERMAEIAHDLNATMYSGGWVNLLNFDSPEQDTAVTPKNTFTTMADICNPQRPFIPANSVKTGTIFRIMAWGTVGSAAGTATTTMGLYLNGAAAGTQLAVTAAQTPATSTVNCWNMDTQARVVSIGAAGTIVTIGDVMGINATATTGVLMPATLPAAAAFNTTQANSITIAASWSVSAAGNTYSVHGFTVEQLN